MNIVQLLPRVIGQAIVNSLLIGAAGYLVSLVLLRFFCRFSSIIKYHISNAALAATLLSFLMPFNNLSKSSPSAASNTISTVVHSNCEQTKNSTLRSDISQSNSSFQGPVEFTSMAGILAIADPYFDKYGSWIFFIYFIGLLLFSLKITWAYFHSLDLRKNSFPADENWQSHLAQATNKLGITRGIRIAFTASKITPCIIGYSKALILVPVSLINNLTNEQAEAILLHELAHFKHFDYYINIALQLTGCVLFFNPFVWLMRSKSMFYRELACDETAMAHDRNIALAESLAYIASWQSAGTSLPLLLTGGRHSLVYRIRHLLQYESPKRSNGSYLVLATLCLTIILLSYSGTRLFSMKRDNLKAQLERISRQMYLEGNEKYVIVDAIKDSIVSLGGEIDVTYMGGNTLFVSGNKCRAVDGSGTIMSRQQKEDYVTKLGEFLRRQGQTEMTPVEITTKYLRNTQPGSEYLTLAEILDPISPFRKVNKHDRYMAGIRHRAEQKLIRCLLTDHALSPEKGFEILYDEEGITVNNYRLEGVMKEKYVTFFRNNIGIDLKTDNISGRINSDKPAVVFIAPEHPEQTNEKRPRGDLRSGFSDPKQRVRTGTERIEPGNKRNPLEKFPEKNGNQTNYSSVPPDLTKQLNEISDLMFADGNEKYVVVDAIRDGVITFNQHYSFIIMDRAPIETGLPEIPENLRGRYFTKMKQFMAGLDEQGNTMCVGNRKGVALEEVLNPSSSFRKVNVIERNRAGIRTSGQKKMWGYFIDDKLIGAQDTALYITYANNGVFVNFRKIPDPMTEKYNRLFREVYGVDLSYDTYSGQWKKG